MAWVEVTMEAPTEFPGAKQGSFNAAGHLNVMRAPAANDASTALSLAAAKQPDKANKKNENKEAFMVCSQGLLHLGRRESETLVLEESPVFDDQSLVFFDERGRSNSNSDLSYHLDDRNHSKSSPPGVEFCDIHPYAVDSSSSLSLSLSPSSAAAKKKKKPPVVAPVYVKIAPGLTARLRRVQETYACIAKDYYIPTSCVDCSSSLFCIQDANYVLCPLCKVVGRLEGGADLEYNGGVGIGFTWEYLQQFQQKLVRGRMEQQPSGRPRLHTTGDFYF